MPTPSAAWRMRPIAASQTRSDQPINFVAIDAPAATPERYRQARAKRRHTSALALPSCDTSIVGAASVASA